MQLDINFSEMRAMLFAFDFYIDSAGLDLADCQIMIRMLNQYIQALEQTDQHGAIRIAYSQLNEYLKYEADLLAKAA